MLECSEYLEFQSYSEIWELGSEYAEANPWSLTSLMRYKLNSGDLPAASLAAINILDMYLSDYYYAQAYLVVAETDFRLDNFQDAIRSLVRIRELYPDFPDIIKAASFLQIKSLLQSGAISEAQQLYWES
jgi:tetratricopeptide (TPR) repeat protein